MTAPYFIWNSVSSSDMGVLVDAYPPVPRAKERVESVTVPGRQGALTLLEASEEMYEPVVISIDCFLTKTANLETVLNWLRGAGDLVLGSQPARVYQNARAVNQIDFSLFLFHRKQGRFTVVFECPPFKGVYPGPAAIAITGSTARDTAFSLTNAGTLTAYPLIELTISGTRAVTFTWSGNVFSVANVSTRLTIDCEAQEVLDSGGSPITIRSTGTFPALAPGTHSCVLSRYVTAASITMRERYL